MGRAWQVKDAQDALDRVIDAAITDGPQVITRQGQEAAIVLSAEDYQSLIRRQQTTSEFFLSSPLAGSELDLSRDQGGYREDLKF